MKTLNLTELDAMAFWKSSQSGDTPLTCAHLRFFRRPARVAGARTEMLALQKNLRCAQLCCVLTIQLNIF